MKKEIIFGLITALIFSSILSAYSEVQVGVKTGDWIRYDYTISGTPPGSMPQWIKAEFLDVIGTTATVRVTMHMSDGTEQNQTMTIDVATGMGTTTFQGLVIPANSSVGDTIYISGYGNLTIVGETTRTYVGASRTVVYANFSQSGTQLTYYWDKQTGVMAEASVTSGTMTGTAKPTATNMWQAQLFGLDPIVFYAIIIGVIVIVVALTLFAVRKKKKPSQQVTPAET